MPMCADLLYQLNTAFYYVSSMNEHAFAQPATNIVHLVVVIKIGFHKHSVTKLKPFGKV